jgi:DNA mismatch repair protein MutS
VRLECKDGEHYMATTSKRAAAIQRHPGYDGSSTDDLDLPLADGVRITDIRVTVTNASARMSCPQLRDWSATVLRQTEALRGACKDAFDGLCRRLFDGYGALFPALARFVSTVDFLKSAAKCARLNRYCRPAVVGDEDSGVESFFRATALRHPVVEQLLRSRVAYVPNDVALGSEGTSGDAEHPGTGRCDPDGVLLYSTNSAGKTVLMRSIGLAVIMAQAGLYVPATAFTIRPFRRIMTRILSNDCMARGLSSFAVEMSELRGILRRAGADTLVLADEPCHSTESASGISIVVATVVSLAAKRVKFLFTTHLHELSTMDRITRLPTVAHKHLEVRYDEARDLLVYDRVLRDGSGSCLYGLSVAKACGIPPDTIALAHEIRREVLAERQSLEPVRTTASRYNARVFLTPCTVCHGCKNVESHHIVFQRDAVDGFVGHVHKHHTSNISLLCESCHDAVHRGELIIHGFEETSGGVRLSFSRRKPA